jgi:DNA polymerase-3 subunit delta
MRTLELKKAIQKRELSPLYFFYGEETFLIDRILTDLKEVMIDPHLSDFNLSIFYGEEITPQDIINSAKTLPLMSDYRLVIVRESDQLKLSSWKRFSSYFSHPLLSTCLIFCAEKMVLNPELLSIFRKEGKVVRFYHPFDREVPEWIRKIAREFNKKIRQDALVLLSAELGNDLQKIYNELQKIAAYVGERGTIERDDVEEAIADIKGTTVFDLLDCIGSKDVEGALNALKRLIESGEQPLRILSMITLRIRQYAKAKEMLQEGSSHVDVGRRLGIRDFYLKGFLEQVHTFPLNRVEACFACLFRSDWKLKSSRINKRLILERLITDLCGY